MDVNLNGAFYTAQAAGRIFERQVKEGKNGFRQGSVVFKSKISPGTAAPYNL
jgi:sorbose reductase